MLAFIKKTTWLKSAKSGISKLALLFSLSASLSAAINTDRFLVKVNDDILTLKDLKVLSSDLRAMRCYLPDSLLLDYLGGSFFSTLDPIIKKLDRTEYSLTDASPEIPFLSSLRQLWKTKLYINTQKVMIAPVLSQELLRSSMRGSCPRIHLKNQLSKSFSSLLSAEVYLRSRFLPSKGVMEGDTKKKRYQSLSLFMDSIDRQLLHENFW
jgi:hypothetical protein